LKSLGRSASDLGDPNLLAIQGGIVIRSLADKSVIGSIGVSGGASEEDEAIARLVRRRSRDAEQQEPQNRTIGKSMAKIPKVLQEHINKAFPENACLVATALPNGFAEVTPRGSTMVFDDEHIGLWERGRARPMRIFARAARSRSFFEIRNCGLTAHCPPAPRDGDEIETKEYAAGGSDELFESCLELLQKASSQLFR